MDEWIGFGSFRVRSFRLFNLESIFESEEKCFRELCKEFGEFFDVKLESFVKISDEEKGVLVIFDIGRCVEN